MCECVPGTMAFEDGTMSVQDWLGFLHLDQYTEQFRDNSYHQLSDCWDLRGEDLSRIGILLPGHRKRILSALRKGSVAHSPGPESPGQPPASPEPPQAGREKPVPRKRTVYPYGHCPSNAAAGARPPAERPLPSVPPAQASGRPPVPRPRDLTRAPPVGHRTRPAELGERPVMFQRDLPVLLPRQDMETKRRPPPLPARPLPRAQVWAPAADSSTTPKVYLDDLKARRQTPPLLVPRTKLSLQPQSGLNPPPKHPFALLKQKGYGPNAGKWD
ncbi:arf-GAP with Rho-GAP domain, ANK repeat and PH domain-containing protein 1-like isoform X2 [Pristis pectinata]|uniref:arf-GAP with Rho-GAP domain, ANK repeat and PH domain-containing protein 1-like isoform X2 n=1 Tax=Pristis pectinata TaxID=685728 RepID=UPI00223D991A|nr:arf-GAP with Rho-GAP domain, ANK repeat and PH domain-containing protein 1-like isoform X2 [Pristis pectinata]